MSDPATWRAATRVDRGGRLSKAERVAAGGVRLSRSVVARAGIYTYQRADGSVTRELLPPDEAKSEESLKSLRDAPVTVDHPAGMVSPETYRRDAVGHISGDPSCDGRYIYADVIVHDAEAIRRIDAGELIETSPGYRLMIDPTPGVWNGERYDAVQRARVYNHLAIGPRGWARAGAEACLRIDGVDDVAVEVRAPEDDGEIMKTDRIDGVDYELGSVSWVQARQRFDAKQAETIAALEKRAREAETRADDAAVEAGVAKKELVEAKKELADKTSPERISDLVAARASLVAFAKQILGDEAALAAVEGKSDREIMKAILATLDPDGEEEAAKNVGTGPDAEAAADSALRIRFAVAKRLAERSPAASPLARARQGALVSPAAFNSAASNRPRVDDFEPPPRLTDAWKRRSA